MKAKIEKIDSPKGIISLITLTNSKGASVTLSSLGAGIVKIAVPDRNGELADIVMGYENPCDYIYDGPCCGKIPGRYANRIARGVFTLGGKEYKLNVNCGPNHLHGGPEGVQNQNWNFAVDGETGDVTFTLKSNDGDENYPGNIEIRANYLWTEANELHLTLEAVTDALTILNLTNHTYFCLSGHNAANALNHELQLFCSKYLETDESLAPTGKLMSVKGTPMDFTTSHAVKQAINEDFKPLKIGKGYDHCWVVDGYSDSEKRVRPIAILKDAASGRKLQIDSTQPGVQVYTGNWLTGSPKGKDGYDYKDYDCIAIECQGLPDAPNHPNFPSQTIRPDKKYSHKIIFKFTTF